MSNRDVTRRRLLALSAAGITIGAVPAYIRAALPLTPSQTEGPFYPDRLPLDRDNDLLTFDGARAMGDPAEVTGRVLDAEGRPLGGMTVEIWQCDAEGYYKHVSATSGGDPNFQGFGRTESAANGGYRFRTIVPVPYRSRTPHIHFKIRGRGVEALTTQLYIRGHPQNAGDFVFRRIPEELRESVMADFEPASAGGPAMARFDIVLGPDFVRDDGG